KRPSKETSRAFSFCPPRLDLGVFGSCWEPRAGGPWRVWEEPLKAMLKRREVGRGWARLGAAGRGASGPGGAQDAPAGPAQDEPYGTAQAAARGQLSMPNRSSRSARVSRFSPPASSLSTEATRSFFFCLSCRIFSSMVPAATSRYTETTFFC